MLKNSDKNFYNVDGQTSPVISILEDINTNIKIIVEGYLQDNSQGQPARVYVKYKRMKDSLPDVAKIKSGPTNTSCHFYYYKGNKNPFNLDDAKKILIKQINSDTFEDIFKGNTSQLTNGEIEKNILLNFVNKTLTTAVKNKEVYNIPELSHNGNKVSGLTDDQMVDYKKLIYSVNPTNQEIKIVWPASCDPCAPNLIDPPGNERPRLLE